MSFLPVKWTFTQKSSVPASEGSQIPTAPSKLPLANCLASGLHATDPTLAECPVRVRSSCPVPASHTLTVLSELPLANCLASGLHATNPTLAECPVRVRSSCPVPASHTLTVLSELPLANCLASGLHAT